MGDTPRQLPAVPGHQEGVRESSTDDHSEAATHQPGHPTTAALGEVRESVMRTDSGLRYQGDRGQHREVVIGPANNKQAKVLHILIWSTVRSLLNRITLRHLWICLTVKVFLIYFTFKVSQHDFIIKTFLQGRFLNISLITMIPQSRN